MSTSNNISIEVWEFVRD